MRIRTIKPEFYRSADIADLAIEDRLLFIGMWSYVDDNGVGRDEEDLIVTDLFPKDYFRDPAGTLARVATGLARLADAGLIVRYEVDSRRYLQVTNWGRHQKIDRPNKPRYPRSDADSAQLATTLASVATIPSWGTGDQGIRGSEDQGGKRPRRTPSRPIPDDWNPSDTHKAKADEEHIDLPHEAEKFRNHALAKDMRYANWDRAFTNWLSKDWVKKTSTGLNPMKDW